MDYQQIASDSKSIFSNIIVEFWRNWGKLGAALFWMHQITPECHLIPFVDELERQIQWFSFPIHTKDKKNKKDMQFLKNEMLANIEQRIQHNLI